MKIKPFWGLTVLIGFGLSSFISVKVRMSP
jgi:hypothetical protein